MMLENTNSCHSVSVCVAETHALPSAPKLPWSHRGVEGFRAHWSVLWSWACELVCSKWRISLGNQMWVEFFQMSGDSEPDLRIMNSDSRFRSPLQIYAHLASQNVTLFRNGVFVNIFVQDDIILSIGWTLNPMAAMRTKRHMERKVHEEILGWCQYKPPYAWHH